MNSIAITNPPWYYYTDSGMHIGIRAGSRWPFSISYQDDIKVRYRPFPFFMAYATSYLKSNNITAHFIDSITAGHTREQFNLIIEDLNPNFILIETSSASINNDLAIASMLNSHDKKIILTGAHATVFASELISHPSIFAILKGEYEVSLLKFMKNPQPKIYGYENINLDELPFPYREDNLLFLYKEKTHNNIPFQISLIASRGCRFACSFCQWPPVMYNNKLRERSIENIEAEIRYLIEKYGENIFLYFDDDTFNLKEERTLQIARMIKKYNLKWSAMCRIDTLNKSAWKECYNCGLTCVNIGIETANSRLLKIINKKLNIKEAEDKINYLKKLGMYIHCTFTWGIPGETKENVLETREFFKRINVQSKQESKVQPLPGTPWWKSIKSKDHLSYDGYNELDITRKEYHL